MKKRVFKVLIYLYLFCYIFSVSYCNSTKKVTVGEVEGFSDTKQETIYDVEISWGDMKFTNTETKEINWDNEENKYKIEIENNWINENNEISVKNFSNSVVTVNFECNIYKKDVDLIGTFSKNKINIGRNKEGKTMFNLSGSINSNIKDYIKIGTITINIE